MANVACARCGSYGLTMGYMSIGCPLCGERVYSPVDDKALMWAEHRLGLMYGRGGWRWMLAVEPPSWFYEEVV